ncbi:MAG TPA: dCTP deaminase [Dehalococcoidia bacterium]|nr:dCTP deaminase [Dehalococcoidia bacterium]
MILSNISIHEALDDGRLAIEPQPAPRFNSIDGKESPYQTSSVDLTLAPNLSVEKDEQLAISIDLRQAEKVAGTLSTLSRPIEIDPAQGFLLRPNQFVLGRTSERVKLTLPAEYTDEANGKPCLAARVEGMSSRARFGILVHFTAPTIHAGFDGTITLEIKNLGWFPFVLYRNMPICQLIIEQVEGVPAPNESQFQGQATPAGTQ